MDQDNNANLMKRCKRLYANNNFERLFNEVKTLSFQESFGIFEYLNKRRPKVICEFGTQLGASTLVFVKMCQDLGLNASIHSWDVVNVVKFPKSGSFEFHQEDITGREKEFFDKYHPELLFLDAHPYVLTKKLMKICMDRKVDFICHDVILPLYMNTKKESNNFIDKSSSKVAWELYLLCELISPILLTENSFDNEDLHVKMIRDRFGIAVVEQKRKVII